MRRPVLASLIAALAVSAAAAPALAAAPVAPPVFREYHGPASPPDAKGAATGADAAGEPSIGYDSRTGAFVYMANKATYRVTGFDLSRDEAATWKDVTDPVEGAQTSDPILYTDPVTNRTFVNQLELQGGSLQAYTDDDGATYTHSTMGSAVGLAFDHQTIAAGRPPAGSLLTPVGYPNLLYYCTNDLEAADCGVSVDGGLNFLAATPAYTVASSGCSRIFGHIKTDPRDGTLYLPPNGCGGKQQVYVSHDATRTWTASPAIGTAGDQGHPAVAVAKDGTLYFAYGSADTHSGSDYNTGRVHVAVSTDQAKTWTSDSVLGADQGIVATRFPTVVAGDGDRAVVAFLGAKAAGDPSAAPDATNAAVVPYTGTWDLYLSYTTDRGATWTTYDATPGKPVQVGPVCTRGTTCLAGRNLLDFNDLQLDGSGRPVVAYADGALAPGDDYRKGLAKATVLRVSGGPQLDTALPDVPSGPTPVVPEVPSALLLPAAAAALLAVGLRRRRRHG